MMLAILAAAIVAAEPPAASTPPAALATSARAPELSAVEQVRQLQMIYDQSCGDRAYGSFGEACAQMRRQIKDAEKAARKAASARK